MHVRLLVAGADQNMLLRDGGFPKIRGPFMGGPHDEDYSIWRSILGTPYDENYQAQTL